MAETQFDVIFDPAKSSKASGAPKSSPAFDVIADTNQSPRQKKFSLPSPLRSFLEPITSIPGEIGKEFSAGSQDVSAAMSDLDKAMKAGSVLGTQGPSFRALSGGLRQAVSPITGTAKAFTNPLRKAIPGPAGQFAGNLAEDVLELFGPGTVAKGGKAMVDLLKIAPSEFRKAVNMLMDEGIRMTPGQLIGPATKRLENTFKSIPGPGDVAIRAELRSLQDFNRAVLNRALKPIGEKLPKKVTIGRDAIEEAQNIIGKRYDKLIPKLSFRLNQDFGPKLQAVMSDASLAMDESQFNLLKKNVDEIQRRAVSGSIPGKQFKQIDGNLSHLQRTFARSPNPSHTAFARSIGEIRSLLRESLLTSNPKHAKELDDLNTAFAMFARVQDASIARGQSLGIFSPVDLLKSLKRQTTKGVFARGDAALQDIADAGTLVLPPNVPDSGTAIRILTAEALLGGFGGHAIGIEPSTTLPILAGATLPFTRPGVAGANAIAKGIRNLPRTLQQISRAAGPAALGSSELNDLLLSGRKQ